MMNWIKGLFRPKPEPGDERRMAEDWRVGDVAVCCVDDWMADEFAPATPEKGAAYKVKDIRERVAVARNVRIISLVFDEFPRCGWDNRGFRKLRPDVDEAEEEFTAKLREWLKVDA